jgi:hypothetical protein
MIGVNENELGGIVEHHSLLERIVMDFSEEDLDFWRTPCQDPSCHVAEDVIEAVDAIMRVEEDITSDLDRIQYEIDQARKHLTRDPLIGNRQISVATCATRLSTLLERRTDLYGGLRRAAQATTSCDHPLQITPADGEGGVTVSYATATGA